MDSKKSQLNVQIDPQLLIRLKSEAIQSGKTLAAFVTDRLEKVSENVKDDILEQRLLRIEQQISSLKKFTSQSEEVDDLTRDIFSDKGAKNYGDITKKLFELHREEKKLSFDDAFAELTFYLDKHDADSELIYSLLKGNHVLTGKQMTYAYRHGSCGMRSALSEWSNDSLEPLNEAFLNAVETDNLL